MAVMKKRREAGMSSKLLVHDKDIDKAKAGAPKCARESADNVKATTLPELDSAIIGRDDEVILHGRVT
jgi:hypothetical protein